MDNSSARIEHWLPASAAALLFSGLLCVAGDPIVFSNEKSKPDPSKEIQKERELLKTWELGNRPFDSEALTLPRPGQRGAHKLTKEEKQRRNAQDEKKNWLLLRPGQLQEEDERKNQLGIRDYDLQKPEDENAPRDYTFYGLSGHKNLDPQSKSTQGRADNKNSGRPNGDQPGRKDSVREDEESSGRESFSKNGSANQAGAHTVNELDLKDLLNPSQKSSSGRSSEKTDFTLKDLLGSTAPARSREQTERINAWRRDVLNAPEAGASGPGLGDAAKSDFGRSGANGAFAKPLDAPARSGGNAIFNPSANLGLGAPVGSRGLVTPGLPDTRSLSVPASPSYPGYNPAYNSPDSQSPLQRVQPTVLEVPRRRF